MKKFTKLQEKWLTALESGEYRQGRGQLVEFAKGGDKFCCLGVAADVCGLEFDENGCIKDGAGRLGCVLPGRIAEKLRIRFQDRFYGMNDDEGLTFKQIAKRVRNDPEAFFTNFGGA